jgi:hypothetical protein
MADKKRGSQVYATGDFDLREAGVAAGEVILKGELCTTVVNQLTKINTDTPDLSTGFAQATENITGGATDGEVKTQVIIRGARIIMDCQPNLESGQLVQLGVGGGVQTALPAGSAALAGGQVIGVFQSYVDIPLTENPTVVTPGVIQT